MAGDADSSGLPGAAGDGLAGGATTAFAGADEEVGGVLSACASEGFSAGGVADVTGAAGEDAGLETVPALWVVGVPLAIPAAGFSGATVGLAGALAGEAADLGVEVFFGVAATAFDVGRACSLRAAGVTAGLGDTGRLTAVFAGVGAAFVPPDASGFGVCAAHASIKGAAAHIDTTMPITQTFRNALR